MEYVAHRRFKRKGLCGEVNIPARSVCEEKNGVICYNGKEICYFKSLNAYQYFARNDDGNGILRGKLTQAIEKTLNTPDKQNLGRWEKVFKDYICKRYKREEYADTWYWNHDFYNASIDNLKYIAKLIGAKVK